MGDKYIIYNGQIYLINDIHIDTDTGETTFNTMIRNEPVFNNKSLLENLIRAGDDLPKAIVEWFIDSKRELNQYDNRTFTMNMEKNIDTIRKLIDPKISIYTVIDIINIFHFIFHTPYWNNRIMNPLNLVKRMSGVRQIDKIFAQYKNYILAKSKNKQYSGLIVDSEAFKEL